MKNPPGPATCNDETEGGVSGSTSGRFRQRWTVPVVVALVRRIGPLRSVLDGTGGVEVRVGLREPDGHERPDRPEHERVEKAGQPDRRHQRRAARRRLDGDREQERTDGHQREVADGDCRAERQRVPEVGRPGGPNGKEAGQEHEGRRDYVQDRRERVQLDDVVDDLGSAAQRHVDVERRGRPVGVVEDPADDFPDDSLSAQRLDDLIEVRLSDGRSREHVPQYVRYASPARCRDSAADGIAHRPRSRVDICLWAPHTQTTITPGKTPTSMPGKEDLAAAVGLDRVGTPSESLRIAPRQYTVSEGVIERIEATVRDRGDVSSVGILASTSGEAAVGSDVETAIERAGVECEFRRFDGECTVPAVRRHREAFAEESDLIVGVGGGKALDTAKLVAEGRCPVVTVPTNAATSAAWTALSVVYDEDGLYRGGVRLSGCPDALFLDPTVVADAPARYLANGVMDASAKFFETALMAEGELGPLATLGRSVAQEVYADLLRTYAGPAIADARADEVTPALTAASEAAIAGPGVAVGLLSDRSYLLSYGAVQAESYHGERVAYGVLVTQALLGQATPELRALKRWYESLGEAMTLSNLGVEPSEATIQSLGRDAHDGLAYNLLPRTVSASDVTEAIERIEAMPSTADQ